MDLKDRIEKIISYTELTPSEFADEIDVQRSSISHITSGRNKPSLDFLLKIKKRFPEFRWEWLIEGQGDMREKSVQEELSPEHSRPTSLPELFSLINDEAFGVTESEDKIAADSSSESVIRAQESNRGQISDSERLAEAAKNDIRNPSIPSERTLKKIVFFYSDGKFESFEP